LKKEKNIRKGKNIRGVKMDWVKDALFVGAAAYIYQTITHNKVLEDANLKYATLGGVFGLLVGPKLEQYIKNDADIRPEIKDKLLATALFGAAGYAIGDKVVGQAKKSFGGLEKKIGKPAADKAPV
jgi:hypothetical protein